MLSIEPARTAADHAAAGLLFDAYAASLGIDLGFQGFAAEREGLPGVYAPPAGALLLARTGTAPAAAPVGCVALRPLAYAGMPPGCCEMKRLYVAPEGRGLGAGRALIAAVVAAARMAGYRRMWLDTLPELSAAVALYRQAGFTEIPAYNTTPVARTLYLGLTLQA